MRIRANTQALVAKKVHAKVTLETLFANFVALKAARVALIANLVHDKVVAGTVVPARSIKVKWQFGTRPRIAFKALSWLTNWTFPAGPITI